MASQPIDLPRPLVAGHCPMRTPGWLAMLLVVLAAAPASHVRGEDWPAWRGPRGDGTSQETGLPVVWSEQSNLVWKTPLPEWGTSTPAVWQDSIFVTTQDADDALRVIKLRASSGAVQWNHKFGSGRAERAGLQRGRQNFHDLHNLASPSPVTDGRYVIVHFGNGELACYDFAGELLWQHSLQTEHGNYTVWWGHANSPVIFNDLVISVCLQDSLADKEGPPAVSYLVAHDLATGRQRWKTERSTGAKAEEGDAYTTPVLTKVGFQNELIVMGANQLDAYDPADGQQLWYLPGLVGGRTVTGPTVAEGLVYVTRGMRGPLLAVTLAGKGKRGPRDIVWHYDQGTPDTCAPVVSDGLVFTISDDGIARAMDADTGHLQWKQRLKGEFKASPVAAEGRVYFLNTAGLCTVVSASNRFDRLAENQLRDTTLASPAIAHKKLYIRGRKFLYCLGKK